MAPRVAVVQARAEELAAEDVHREAWPAITMRAVAALGESIELAFPLLAPGGALVAWKRGDLTAEVAGARRAVAALGGGSIDLLDAAVPGLPDHRLVVVTRTGPLPTGYPRSPAARRRRPW
jgi:16S rRNA (guanine527-N7)-methyltransferase